MAHSESLPESSPQPEGAPQSAFFELLEYPESAVHQAQFDGIVDEIMPRLKPDYQTTFRFCSDIIRWGLWPSDALPAGITTDAGVHGLDMQCTYGVRWAANVLKQHGLLDIRDDVQERRRSSSQAARDLIKSKVAEHDIVTYIDSFNTTSRCTDERSLTNNEVLTRQAELRRQLGMTTPELPYDDPQRMHMWRTGLRRIEEEVATEPRSSSALPIDKLVAYTLRLIQTEYPGCKDTEATIIRDALNYTEDKDTFIYAASGGVSLFPFDKPGELYHRTWSISHYLECLIRELHNGAPFAHAKDTALDAFAREAWDIIQCYELNEDYHYTSIAGFGRLNRLSAPLPPGTLPKLRFPEYDNCMTIETIDDSEGGSSSLAPLAKPASVPKPQPSGRLSRSTAVEDLSFQCNELDHTLFATKHSPLVGKPRLLELVDAYDLREDGATDMHITFRDLLHPDTMPFVPGYDLIDFEGKDYYFTRAQTEPYLPACIPIEDDARQRLADQCAAVKLEKLAERIGDDDALTLEGLRQALQHTSTYVLWPKAFRQFHNMSIRRIADIAPLVQNNRFYTQCSGAVLLLRAAVQIALPEAKTAIRGGKSLPEIGRHIAVMDHVELEVMTDTRLYRLDATPGGFHPRDLLSLPSMLSSSRKRTEKPVTTPAKPAKEALQKVNQRLQTTAYAKELMCSIFDCTPQTTLDRAAALSEDDPLRKSIALLTSDRTYPDEMEAQEIARYLRSIVDADVSLLKSLGFGRYDGYRPSLALLARRIESMYD